MSLMAASTSTFGKVIVNTSYRAVPWCRRENAVRQRLRGKGQPWYPCGIAAPHQKVDYG